MLQSHRGQHRPHRRGHAVRGARADGGRRLDDLDGDAAQRRRHRPQGHPRGRDGDHREGRRRHSARRRSGRPRRRPTSGAVGDADRRVRCAAARCSKRRRRGGVAMREQLVPGEAAARPRALRLARRDEHRGPGRIAGRPAVRARPGARATPTSITSTAERSSKALDRGWARSRAAEAARPRSSKSKSQRRVAAALWRSASATSASAARRCWPITSARSMRSSARRLERARAGARDRAGAGGLGAQLLRRAAQPRADRRAARGRRQADR